MPQQVEVDTPRAIAAGIAAGTSFLGAMWLDNRLSSHEFNDLKLVGQIFTTKWPWWAVQGLTVHYFVSVVVALFYAKFVYPRLPGPGVLKGIIFLNIENVAFYPGALLADRLHAGIRGGQLPPLLNMKTFLGQVVRHIAFGAALGLLYKSEA
jgi:hypothetical protein